MRELADQSNPLDFNEVKLGMEETVLGLWDRCDTKQDLCRCIEDGYIFGDFDNNKHYKSSDIMMLINEVWAKKHPVEEVIRWVC